MILVIDNYDSFTFNLVQLMGELGADPRVYRNDAILPAAALRLEPRAIVISPGPGTPLQAGVSMAMIRELSGTLPILGVCLGHQALGAVFGGRIARTHPLHGKASAIQHDGTGLFAGMPSPFLGGRYHSLVVESEGLSEDIAVTARTSDGIIMGLRHARHPTFGVQFHPESILTEGGRILLGNFLRLAGEVS